MDTRDISFLGSKKFIGLLLVLVTFNFVHVALTQVYSIVVGPKEIVPFIEISNPVLSWIGFIIPLLALIGLYLYSRSKTNEDITLPSQRTTMITIFVLVLGFILYVSAITMHTPPSDVEITTTITSTSVTTPTTSSQPVTSPGQTTPTQAPEAIMDIQLIWALFALGLLGLPLILIIISVTKAHASQHDISELDKTVPTELDQKSFSIRNILESYYQASTVLEEKGADSTPSLTPTEFVDDVTTKQLTKPKNISNLTNLFEEAKFSNHPISDKQVDQAKQLAKGIILTDQDEIDQKDKSSSNDQLSSSSNTHEIEGGHDTD